MDTYENENPEVIEPQPEMNDTPIVEVESQVEPTAVEPIIEPVTQPVRQTPVNTAPQFEEFPPKRQKKKSRKGLLAVIAVAAALALVIGTASITATVVSGSWQAEKKAMMQSFDERLTALRQEIEDKTYVGNGNSVSGTPNTTTDGSMTPAQVYAKHVASVVAIHCSNGSGSGFILSADGYIATNYHVVEGATNVSIVCYDGNEYAASYVGGDQASDIAVLKVAATGLQPAVIGRSDHLIVGDQVVAIGNPLGELASTLTVGYVSAKDRLVTTEGTSQNMIQTDAAINNGNSGGPLFNMKGEVVGITSVKYSGMTSSGATIEGLGFAIPMDDVIGMFEDLMEKGYISGAYLGVSVKDVTQLENTAYGIPLGVRVTLVNNGSCAQKGGIQVRDVITNLGGYEVENVNDLTRALRKFNAGDTVSATVFRIGTGNVTLSLTLDEKPAPDQQTSMPTQGQLPSGGSSQDWFDHFFGS